MCSDSIFNMLKRVTDGSLLFLCKTLFFYFLEFGSPNYCPKNRYTDFKPALDQLTVSEAVPSIMAQSWLWGSQIADRFIYLHDNKGQTQNPYLAKLKSCSY